MFKLIPTVNGCTTKYEFAQLQPYDGLVHRAITYKQSFWLVKYIDHNTKICAKVKTDFEREF